MNREDSLIIREIKNYINSEEKTNSNKNKEDIIKQIEDRISDNSDNSNNKFNNILNLLKKLKNELEIDEKDSEKIKNKKKELSDFIFHKKEEDNKNQKINLTISSYSKNKIIFLLKELKMIFSKNKQIIKSETFSILKRNFLILKNSNLKKEIILKRITYIKKIFSITKIYHKKLLPFSKRRGFLKWKIKSNEYFLKSCVSKIAINARINSIVVLWRLKKILEKKNFDENLKFLKFVEKLSNVTEKAEIGHNFNMKFLGFENIIIFGLKLKEFNILVNSKKICEIFNKKIKLKAKKNFDKILLKNPKKLLFERLIGKIIVKQKNCFYKLFFLLENKKVEKFYQFNILVLSKLKNKSKKVFSILKNPYMFFEEILNNLRKKNLRSFFQNIKRINFANEKKKEKLDNFLDLINKKIFLNKKKSFCEILNKKLDKKKKIRKFI